MEFISDWPSVFTVLGAISLLLGTLYRSFKKDKKWQEPLQNMEIRVNRIEEKLNSIETKINDKDEITDDKNQHVLTRLDKAEQKVEKLTDILIKYIGKDKN